MNVLTNFKKIKAFVLDVDGVLTDGRVLLLNDGQMARSMNIKDGYALQLAIKKGYHVLVISGGDDDAVKTRLQKLGVMDVHMKVADKKTLLAEYVNKQTLTWEQVLFMGDDIPDLQAMQIAGLPCCPADAVPEIKSISHYISPINGGAGCVRDIIEKVMKLNGDWDTGAGIASR
ncbi:MAG TPA: HAD-IIIA family hydrolase [Ferruginibacter sp.]|nr:HAD-IIIA family hydrolase [Ferruginibacter sp.]